VRIPGLPGPRLCVTGISIGVAGGTAVSVYTGRIDLIASPFVLAGCIVLLRSVWKKPTMWPATLRSTTFWIGIGLAVVGNLIWFVRST
jgi:hypothetical protein